MARMMYGGGNVWWGSCIVAVMYGGGEGEDDVWWG